MKAPDKNSKRSKRRANRNFTESRPNRRAKRRLAIKQAGASGPGYRKAGNGKHW